MREVFSDVPNPAILLRWFIFLKLVKLWLNPGPEKTPLILILWPKQHSVKAFFSVSARHCKRALVPMMAVWFFPSPILFGQNIRCEVEQTSEDFIGPGTKLADSLTHLTTGEAMKPLRHWFRSTTWPQDFNFFFLLEKRRVFGSAWWMSVRLNQQFYLNSFPVLFVVTTFASVALQETEMENLQRMKRVRTITCRSLMKYQS